MFCLTTHAMQIPIVAMNPACFGAIVSILKLQGNVHFGPSHELLLLLAIMYTHVQLEQ